MQLKLLSFNKNIFLNDLKISEGKLTLESNLYLIVLTLFLINKNNYRFVILNFEFKKYGFKSLFID